MNPYILGIKHEDFSWMANLHSFLLQPFLATISCNCKYQTFPKFCDKTSGAIYPKVPLASVMDTKQWLLEQNLAKPKSETFGVNLSSCKTL